MIDAFVGRKQLERSIPCVAAAGVIVAALNWPHERVRVRFSEPAALASDSDYLGLGSQLDVETIGRFAGWPVSIPFDTNTAAQPGSLATTVGIDALVAVALCLLAGVFAIAVTAIKRRGTASMEQSTERSSRESTRGYGLTWPAGLAAAVCLGLVASLFVQGLLAERRLEEALARHGMVSRAAEMPGFVARWLPHWAMAPLARIESVSVHAAPSELVEQALALPSLRSLTIRNQPISAALWRGVIGSRNLDTLSLVNCKWRGGAPPAPTDASAGNTLRSLSIDRCGGRSFAESLQHFPNLQSLVLTNTSLPTDVSIEEWLPRKLKDLCLTADTEAASVKLSKLDQLVTLALLPGTKPSAQGVLSVELSDLPQVATVSVPAVVHLDLTVKNLPRLQRFVTFASRHVRSPDNDMPAPLQVCDLTIDGAPCLQELRLSREGLNRLAITGTPNLRSLSITPPPRTPGVRRDSEFHEASVSVGNAAPMDALVRNLATCDGPTSLNLSGLALAGVDLAPLSQNPRIKELALADSGVRAGQLMSIKHDGRIRSLDLKGCDIDQKDLASILSNYRGIQRLHVDTNRFETLEIIDQPQLTHFFTTPTRAARQVRIIGCPKLTGTLALGHGLKQLEIRDAQSLQGLIVKGWLPSDSVLEGFRDLETVELAGRHVGEQHLKALASCSLLGELTLVMPSIPSSALMDIGKFSELMVLKLPGSQLTDEVVANWGSLPYLREVDFSHTEVTANSIQPLMQCTNLQRLSLAHTNTVAGDLGRLANMKSLLEVDLAGVGMTPSNLRRCLAERFIDRINLSGTSLEDELIDVLASEQAHRLLFIGLKDCRLTDEDILRIATAHPNLAMDIDGNLVSGEVARELNAQGRLIACSDRVGFENWLHHLSTGQPLKDSLGSKKFVRTGVSESSRSAWVSSGRSKAPNRNERSQFRVPTWVRRGIEIWNVQ